MISPAVIVTSVVSKVTDASEARAPQMAKPEEPISRLTAGLVAGHEEAFREIHKTYFDRLYRYLLVITHGNEEAAGDALQETFTRLIRYAKRFNTEEAFWCWLTVVARSAAVDAGRKQQSYWRMLAHYTRLWVAPSKVEPGEDIDGNLYDLLQEGLAGLDDLDRRLVEAKYLNASTVRELAAEMGLSEKGVESRLVRARRQLREHALKRLHHENKK